MSDTQCRHGRTGRPMRELYGYHGEHRRHARDVLDKEGYSGFLLATCRWRRQPAPRPVAGRAAARGLQRREGRKTRYVRSATPGPAWRLSASGRVLAGGRKKTRHTSFSYLRPRTYLLG